LYLSSDQEDFFELNSEYSVPTFTASKNVCKFQLTILISTVTDVVSTSGSVSICASFQPAQKNKTNNKSKYLIPLLLV
jgi:hypothetical protein